MGTSALAPASLVKVSAVRHGAGWAVGDTGILTARHLLAPSPDAQPGRCWAVLDHSPVGLGAECEVLFEDNDRDLALLKVLDADAPAWRSRLGGKRTVLAEPGCRALEVEVIGFPDAALGEDRWPHPEAVKALLLPAGGAVNGRMPLDVTSSVPDSAFGWAGMSGAAVRDLAERLIGIVVDAAADRQQRRLYAAVLPDPQIDGAFALALRRVGAVPCVEDARAPEANRLLGLVDAAGRPYTPMRIPGLDRLGVRLSRSDIDRRENRYYPYARRLMDLELDKALDSRAAGEDTRVLLVTGDAMAGKSRSLAEAVLRHPTIRTWPILKPRAGVPLDKVICFGEGTNALVWLGDDIDLHLGSVSPDQLQRLLRPCLAIVATIRRDQLARLQGSNLKAPWNVISDKTLTEKIALPGELTEQERGWLQLQDPEPSLLQALDDGQSIGEALGAAREMVQRLENPPGDHYVALADAIADWPDTGIPTSLPDTVAGFLWKLYLTGASSKRLARMSDADFKAEYEKVRDWLCQPVAGPGTSIVKRQGSGLVIDGLFQQRRSRRRHILPRQVFEIALTAAGQGIDPDSIMLNIASRAVTAGWTSVAPGEQNPLTESKNADSPSKRSAITDLIRNPARLVIRAPDTVQAGGKIAVLVAGCMLRAVDVERVRVYVDCMINYSYWGARAQPIKAKGKTYYLPVPERYTVTTRRRVAIHEFLASRTLAAGQTFAEYTELSIPADAIGAMYTTAVDVSWEIAAELLTKGRSARAALPVSIIPELTSTPASSTVSGEKVAALSFAEFSDRPLYPGDQFHGKLLIKARHDFVARAITVRLVLRVRVHMKTGHKKKLTYPIYRAECVELQSGQIVEIAFTGTVPSEIPAASVELHHVGDPADKLPGGTVPHIRPTSLGERVGFSAQWELEGAVSLRRGARATIKSNITVARERPSPIPLPRKQEPSRRQYQDAINLRRQRTEDRETLRRRLTDFVSSIGTWQDESLAEILSVLFELEGIQVRDGFTNSKDSGAARNAISGLVDLDGQIFLVGASWQENPLDVSDISGYLVHVFGHPDVKGLMFSASGYTNPALTECRRVLANRVVILADIRELILLLERRITLRIWLAAKLRVATVEGNPFYLPNLDAL